ncbi:transporter substrate-binding domain-containing protein [Oceanicoccus sp. KOV_DT_Chl]|uniref:transporter substrate-binding domain-containing protein n=1 Tax=Oceanicoccus sp. KOV_DT_Chl TaxID=1904639 RepID=UPI000C7B4E48|nr:transporter substrate-binding domain-containing protein [Oceanicoccus sp. KOV_DT_Chl]
MNKPRTWINSVTYTILISILLLTLPTLTLGDDSLIVGVNPEYPPMAFTVNEEIQGIEIDTARQLGLLLKKKIIFKSLDWDELIPAIQAGTIDVIMSGMSITPQRQQKINFTDTTMEIGQMAIIRSSDIVRLSQPAALRQPGIRIGVEKSTTGEQYVRQNLPTAIISGYDTPEAGLAGLRQQQIDFFIHDAPTSWQLAQIPNQNDLIALYRPLTTEYLAWGVNKKNTTLLTELNQALVQLKKRGIINNIQDKWIPIKIEVGQ